MLTMRTVAFIALAGITPACLWCGWRYEAKACDWAAAVLVVLFYAAFYAR